MGCHHTGCVDGEMREGVPWNEGKRRGIGMRRRVVGLTPGIRWIHPVADIPFIRILTRSPSRVIISQLGLETVSIQDSFSCHPFSRSHAAGFLPFTNLLSYSSRSDVRSPSLSHPTQFFEAGRQSVPNLDMLAKLRQAFFGAVLLPINDAHTASVIAGKDSVTVTCGET